MEVKINKEIRDYTESVFFGLSPRQFFYSDSLIDKAFEIAEEVGFQEFIDKNRQ